MRSKNISAAVRKYIHTVRDNQAMKDAAKELLTALEKEITAMEQELIDAHFEISELIRDERFLLDVLQSYGVDLNRLGNRPVELLKAQIQYAKKGEFTVPELLAEFKKNRTLNYKWQ
jgi:hypothetical protein